MNDLKFFVVEELIKIAKECPDYRLRLQALELLYRVVEGMEKKDE